jgi:hypothetical protein
MSDRTANWAILVYISADRVLANFAVESMKQLKRCAGTGTIALVQAHLSNEAEARRYVFDGTSDQDSSIEADREAHISPPLSPGGIADPANLTKFIEWASHYPAKHRCLFLWGHGYELLLNDDQSKAKKSGRNYLAPKSLKEALKNAKRNTADGAIDIIGIDACSLSLFELASELSDCGDYLIASQEDVPDQSFPYDRLLQMLNRDLTRDVEEVAEAAPRLYRQEYQDYVVGDGMGTNEITLTSIRLKKAHALKEPLTRLSTALLSSVFDSSLREAILSARQAARDFALGLFVDLHDFCIHLSGRLNDGELKLACNAVAELIDARGADACILENQSAENQATRCHGLSIYFPYLAKAEMDQAGQAFAAGGTDLVDQLPLLIKGGTNHLLKARSVKISEIEQDFEFLSEFKETHWVEFIKRGWSVILATEEASELDEHYSAQQCAVNLLSYCEPAQVASRQVAAGSRA